MTPRDSSHNGFWFDEAAAKKACEFFERFLRHAKGEWAGQRFALSEWQKRDIIRPIFGWRRPDGTRKYRKVYVEVPRKNGKSTLGAGIALCLLFSDGEPGAEIYSAAADRERSVLHRSDAGASRYCFLSPGHTSEMDVRWGVDSVGEGQKSGWPPKAAHP